MSMCCVRMRRTRKRMFEWAGRYQFVWNFWFSYCGTLGCLNLTYRNALHFLLKLIEQFYNSDKTSIAQRTFDPLRSFFKNRTSRFFLSAFQNWKLMDDPQNLNYRFSKIFFSFSTFKPYFGFVSVKTYLKLRFLTIRF